MAERSNFNITATTIGDDYALATMQALLPDFKNKLAGEQRKIIEREFVNPVKKSELVRKSVKPKNVGSRSPGRGSWWPQQYTKHPAQWKTSKTDRTRFRRKINYKGEPVKRHYNWVSKRQYLRATVRTAKQGQRPPWNAVRVLWGRRPGVPQAWWIIQKYGDFRVDAIRKYAGKVAKETEKVLAAIVTGNQKERRKLNFSLAFKVGTPGELQRQSRRISNAAFKKTSATKVLEQELKRNEDKGIAAYEKRGGGKKVSLPRKAYQVSSDKYLSDAAMAVKKYTQQELGNMGV